MNKRFCGTIFSYKNNSYGLVIVLDNIIKRWKFSLAYNIRVSSIETKDRRLRPKPELQQ